MQPKNTGKPIFIKLMSVFVILGILGMVMPSYDHKQVYAQEESEKDENNSLLYLKGDSYNHYISQYADKAIPDIQVLIPAENFSRTDMEVEVLTDFQGESGKTLKTTEEGYVEWEVDVKEEGLYNIGIRYFPIPGKSSAIEREIRIDGEIPFEGARSLMFHRVWKDATPIIQDKRGNDIRPSQIESPMWQEVVLCDSMGYHNEPYQFYFSKGKHTIQFHSIKEPMAIKWLKLYQETPASDYQTVLEEYNKGHQTYNHSFHIKLYLGGYNLSCLSRQHMFPISSTY